MKKFIHQILAVVLIAVMLLPFAGNAATAYAEETKVAHKGSVTFSDTAWWTAKEISRDELLGSVNPDDVAYIKFSSADTAFWIGYNSTNGSTYWQTEAGVSSHVADDINFPAEAYFLQLMISRGDGVACTINWEVVTGDAEAPVVPTPGETSGGTKAEEKSYTLTTTKGDWGAYTDVIPASAFADITGGAKIVVEFAQETADYYNLAMHSNAAAGWFNLKDYVTNYTFNEWGYIDAIEKGAASATLEISADGIAKLKADGQGALFQMYALTITKATVIPDGTAAATATATPVPTATPTPVPTATPTPTPTPLPKTEVERKEVGGTLVITDKMADKNGTVTIQNLAYDAIVVENGTAVKMVYLKNVGTDSFQVIGGADYTVWARDCELGRVTVAAPKLEGISLTKLSQMLAAKETVTLEQLAQYTAYTKALKQVQDKAVKVVLEGYCTVDAVEIETNAKVDFSRVLEEKKEDAGLELYAEEQLTNIVITNGLENLRKMDVRLTGYKGNVQAVLSDTQSAYTYLYLTLKDSQVEFLSCEGTDGSIYISGNDSNVDAVIADGVNAVIVNVPAENVLVSDATKDAEISIYNKVGTVTVAGEGNDVVLATAAQVKKADITGNSIRVYGYGLLGAAAVTGKGANVAVRGTSVTGDYTSSIPREMTSMAPDVNSSSGSSSTAPEAGTVPTAIHTFKYDSANPQPKYSFLIRDYLPDYADGEKVKITVTMSSTSWYGGGLGANDAITGQYVNVQFANGDDADFTAKAESTIIETYNGYGNIDVAIWWWGNEATLSSQVINIDSITVERVTGGDTKPEVTPVPTEAPAETPAPTEAPAETPAPTEAPAPTETPEVPSAVHTFTYDAENPQPKYSFTILDYLPDYKEGETAKITVNVSSNSWYGFAIGANDANGTDYNIQFQNKDDLTAAAERTIVEKYNGYGDIVVQIYWWGDESKLADQKITIDSITVERVAEESKPEVTPAPTEAPVETPAPTEAPVETPAPTETPEEPSAVHTFTYDAENPQPKYSFKLIDYLPDYKEGETAKITVNLSSNSWFGLGLGANDANGTDYNIQFSNGDDLTAAAERTIVEKYNGYGDIVVQIYWWGDENKLADQKIIIDSITVERVTVE